MFDTEKFIKAVQEREGIWKKITRPYDRNYKQQLWDDIALVMYPEWNTFDGNRKTKIDTELQKKWRNVRDAFVKEIKAQRNDKSGSLARKKRKYIYYDNLEFLIPELGLRRTSQEIAPDEIDYGSMRLGTEESNYGSVKGPSDDADCSNLMNSHERNEKPSKKHSSKSLRKRRHEKKSRKHTSFEHKLLDILRDDSRSIRPSSDEDHSFFNSLIPTVKKFTNREKLLFRMEVLKAIDKIQTMNCPERNGQNHGNSNCLQSGAEFSMREKQPVLEEKSQKLDQ